MTNRERRDFRNGVLFVAPWIIGFVVFTAYPLLSSLYYSFTSYNILTSPTWVGFQNYQTLLQDPEVWTALRHTFIYVLVTIPVGTILSILIAMLLNAKVRLQPLFRTLFYLPVIVPAVAVAVLWKWMYDPSNGLINRVIGWFGVTGPTWLSDSHWVMPAMIFMGLWTIGNAIVMYLASLQDVPEALIEASLIDGANWFVRTTRIVVPMISPIILINVIFGVLGGFQYFTQSFVIFQGSGPDEAALFYATYLYQNAFQFFKMGYASALGWVMFVVILLFTLFIFKSSARVVYYRGEDA